MIDLDEIIVHTDESLPVRFNPITHEVSAPVELPDGNVVVYVRPKEGRTVEQGE